MSSPIVDVPERDIERHYHLTEKSYEGPPLQLQCDRSDDTILPPRLVNLATSLDQGNTVYLYGNAPLYRAHEASGVYDATELVQWYNRVLSLEAIATTLTNEGLYIGSWLDDKVVKGRYSYRKKPVNLYGTATEWITPVTFLIDTATMPTREGTKE